MVQPRLTVHQLSGAVVVIIALFLRETYGPVLLQQKQRRVAAERLKQLELLREHAAVPDSGVHEQHDVLHRVVSAGRPSNPVVRHIRALVPGQAAVAKTKLAFSRPFRLLFTNPICASFSLYMGFIYGIIFLFLTQHPLLFQQRDMAQEDEPRPEDLPTYGWRPGPASMTYLGLGLGFLTAALINVLLQDAIYHRLTASRGRVGWYLFDIPELIEQRMILRDAKSQSSAPVDVEAAATGVPSAEKMQKLEPASSITQEKAAAAAWAAGPSTAAAAPLAPPVRKGRPEYRLPLCLAGMIILPIGLFVFGWAADARTHWMAPLVGSYLVGMGSILPFQVILVYLVDAFVPFSASATACAVLVRSVLAAAFPLFAQKLFVSIGYGAGSSILAGVAILAIPVPLILFWKGEGLRQRYKFTG
jgi:MFS family permease